MSQDRTQRLFDRLSQGLSWVQHQVQDRVDARQAARVRALNLPGLSGRVDVAWDRAGVPHIHAANRRDLFLAQGYVVARERAFQMDFLRRAVSGRLAEVMGRRPVGWKSLTVHLKDKSIADADLLLRTLGLRRGAERSLPLLSPATHEALEAYATGATIAFRALERSRPLEFRLLRYHPEPWTPLDSLCVHKGLAFELSMAWRSVLLFDAIAERLGDDPARVAAFFPSFPEHHAPPAQWQALRARAADLVDLEESVRSFTGTGGAHVGSNAWVVSGEHTTTGKPLLCGDPHLMLTAPSPHMVVHLSCPDLEVVGSAIPGLPGIIIGHNRRVAWTMTASLASDADVFVEELDPSAGTYRAGDRWLPLERRTERIQVKGEPNPWTVEVAETRHGPLVDGVMHALGRTPPDRLGYALRWTGQEGSRDLDTLLAIQSAGSWEEFRGALGGLSGPPLNFLYADVDGHIGWQVAGHIPVRRDGSDGAQPTAGHDDRAGWVRYLELDELPHTFDPPEGFIVSANTKPVDARYPFPLGHNFEPPLRYARIHALLTEKIAAGKVDVVAMRAIQLDQRSAWAERTFAALQRAMAGLTLATPSAQRMLERLRTWDGRPNADAMEPSLFYTTHHHFTQLVLDRALGDDTLAHAYLELLNVSVLPLERIFGEEGSPLLPRAEHAGLLAEAFLRAHADLTDRFGPDPETWRWGRLHTLWHRHRLHELKALRPLLSIGPYPLGGDGFTVWNAHHLHSAPFEVVLGPGVRFIVDVADWERSRFVLSTGNSGNVTSLRYRDHAALWIAGQDHALSFRREPADTRAREQLLPPP